MLAIKLQLKQRIQPVLFLLILAVASFWVWLLTRIPLDDAYIYFRYAENFAKGFGPVFNVAEYVEGYSGFSWLILLTLGACADLPMNLFAQSLSICSYFLVIVILYLYGQKAYPKSARSLLFPLLYTASPACALWAGFALETIFYSLLILLFFMVYLHWNQLRWQRIFTGMLACAVGLSRPEGIVVYAYLLAFEAVHQLCTQKKLHWQRLAEYAMGMILFLFFLYSRYSYYGYLLPNTYYVKVSMNENFWHRGLAYLHEFISTHAGGKLLLGTVFLHGCLFRKASKEWWCLALFIALFFLIVIQSGGDWWPFSRHALPIYPLVVILMGNFFARMFNPAALQRIWRWIIRSAALTLLSITIYTNMNGVLMSSRRFPQSVFTPDYNRAFQTYAKFYGNLLNRILEPQQTFALAPIPFVANYYKGYVLDTLGLTDRHIAHRKIALGGMTHSHEKGDGSYVLAMRPTLFRFFGHLDIYTKPMQYPKPSDVYFVTDREILANPEFKILYEPLAIKVRNLYVMFWKLKKESVKTLPENEINALYDDTIGKMQHWPQDDFLETFYRFYNSAENTFAFRVYQKVRAILSGL